jgi:anti-anti-sigma factor
MTELLIDKVDGILVIRIQLERATLSKATQFKETISEKIESGYKRFIIDCRNVEYMDSTYMGALVVSLKKLKSVGGELKLVFSNKNSPIWLTFETTNMFNVFKSFLSIEEAVESFNKTDE